MPVCTPHAGTESWGNDCSLRVDAKTVQKRRPAYNSRSIRKKKLGNALGTEISTTHLYQADRTRKDLW